MSTYTKSESEFVDKGLPSNGPLMGEVFISTSSAVPGLQPSKMVTACVGHAFADELMQVDIPGTPVRRYRVPSTQPHHAPFPAIYRGGGGLDRNGVQGRDVPVV